MKTTIEVSLCEVQENKFEKKFCLKILREILRRLNEMKDRRQACDIEGLAERR